MSFAPLSAPASGFGAPAPASGFGTPAPPGSFGAAPAAAPVAAAPAAPAANPAMMAFANNAFFGGAEITAAPATSLESGDDGARLGTKALKANVDALVNHTHSEDFMANIQAAATLAANVANKIGELTNVYRQFQQAIANNRVAELLAGNNSLNATMWSAPAEGVPAGPLYAVTEQGLNDSAIQGRSLQAGLAAYRTAGAGQWSAARLPAYADLGRLIKEGAAIAKVPSAENRNKVTDGNIFGKDHHDKDGNITGNTLVNAVAFWYGLIGFVDATTRAGSDERRLCDVALVAIKSTQTGTKNVIDQLRKSLWALDSTKARLQRIVYLVGVGTHTESILLNGRTEAAPAYNAANREKFGFVNGVRYGSQSAATRALKSKKKFTDGDFEGTVVVSSRTTGSEKSAQADEFIHAINYATTASSDPANAAAHLKIQEHNDNNFAKTGKKENAVLLMQVYIQALLSRNSANKLASVADNFAKLSIVSGFGKNIRSMFQALVRGEHTKILGSELLPPYLAFYCSMVIGA